MTPTPPRVSVILPVRNEEGFLARGLEGLVAQDYPADLLEVLIVDGMSTDRTREVAESFREQLPGIRILENPERVVPFAMNRGLRATAGSVIVRLDGHCVPAPDYVRRCVEVLHETGAECVGGNLTTTADGYWGRAISAGMSYSFGVGNNLFRVQGLSSYRGPADTVPFGAWPREVFGEIGLFDEELSNNQDDELAYRIRKYGGTVFLDPSIRAVYYPRTNLRKLWKQYFRYGLFKIRVLQKHPRQLKARQFVPAAFVLTLLAGLGLLPFHAWAAPALAAVALLYGAASLTAGIHLAWRKRWVELPAYPLVFAILHLSYGTGFLVGLVRFGRRWFVPDPELPRLPPPEPESEPSWPSATVIAPMLNEATYIGDFLSSVAEQNYPPDRLEVIIADGGSRDGSRETAERTASALPFALRVVDNPSRNTPEGLNVALGEARGEIIVRMDIHAVYARDYVRECIHHLRQQTYVHVGGPQVARGEGFMGRAIASALNSPFGVGGASFRYLKRRAEVDSIYLGCAYREDLRRLGGWNPEALWDEDTDLNARFRRQGGRLLLVPDIRVRYRPRTRWSGLALQYFRYGLGRARTFRHYPETMRLSHLVPPAFWMTVTMSAVLSLAGIPGAIWTLAGLVSVYALTGLIAAVVAARGRPLHSLLIALTFPFMHLPWTVGFAAGMLRFGIPWAGIRQALSRTVGRAARGDSRGETASGEGPR